MATIACQAIISAMECIWRAAISRVVRHGRSRSPGSSSNYRSSATIPRESRTRWFAGRHQDAFSTTKGLHRAIGVTPCDTGGEGGIRTHGTLAGTTVFETVLFNRSSTSPPLFLMSYLGEVKPCDPLVIPCRWDSSGRHVERRPTPHPRPRATRRSSHPRRWPAGRSGGRRDRRRSPGPGALTAQATAQAAFCSSGPGGTAISGFGDGVASPRGASRPPASTRGAVAAPVTCSMVSNSRAGDSGLLT
jgi:hypothetical protein